MSYLMMCKNCGVLYDYYGMYDHSSFAKFCCKECYLSDFNRREYVYEPDSDYNPSPYDGREALDVYDVIWATITGSFD